MPCFLKTNTTAINCSCFFSCAAHLRSSYTSFTTPSVLRSFSTLLAQLARSVSGTTCDSDLRSSCRQLLRRFSARSTYSIYTSFQNAPTLDVLNAITHSCSTLRVANIGIHLYIFVDYDRALGLCSVADDDIICTNNRSPLFALHR